MVRTRADNCGRKAVASKAPRKNFNSGGSGNSSAASSTYADSPSRNCAGPLINHARMWPTPSWQKGISTFFQKKEKTFEEGSSSTSSPGSSSPTSNERMEAGEEVAIVQNTSCMSEASPESDSPKDSTNLIPTCNTAESSSAVIDDEACSSSSKSSSSSQKSSGKAKVKVAGSNRKRRIVIADDSDDGE